MIGKIIFSNGLNHYLNIFLITVFCIQKFLLASFQPIKNLKVGSMDQMEVNS
jgi:hypothetical protein